MYSSINNIKIHTIAAAVSNRWDSVFDLTDEDESIIQKFVKKTGVEGRYSASIRQTTSDFCFAAAEKIITQKNIDKSKIGVLVFVTQTADYPIPATSCLLQARLGLSKNCIAFDVNLGCSGFTYGIQIAASILNSCEAEYALLLAGDTSAREHSSKKVTKTGHSAALLFGDSGTATLLQKESTSSVNVLSCTDGSGFKAIISPYRGWRNPDLPKDANPGTQMDEIEVFNFATTEVPIQLNEYMQRQNTTPDDYDCLVLHQANKMIMKQICKKTGFNVEKMLISMNKFANTSSSSIPITLVNEYGEDTTNRDIKALCCGFGIGLSWSTLEVKINTSDILPLVHTDEYYSDGYNIDDIKKENE